MCSNDSANKDVPLDLHSLLRTPETFHSAVSASLRTFTSILRSRVNFTPDGAFSVKFGAVRYTVYIPQTEGCW